MSTPVVIIVAALWWAVGVAGFTYWWKYEHDTLAREVRGTAAAAGLLGPLAWVVGYLIHGRAR